MALRNGKLPLVKFDKDSTYESEWLNDTKHGHGIYTWARGYHYEGDYLNGKRHGRGIFTWADGDR